MLHLEAKNETVAIEPWRNYYMPCYKSPEWWVTALCVVIMYVLEKMPPLIWILNITEEP